MLVQTKIGHENSVVGPTSKLGKGLGLVRPALGDVLTRPFTKESSHPFSISVLPGSATRRATELKPDIVNLHWVTDEFLSIESLRKFAVPVVWTLHDAWAFTGGCHYPARCMAYRESCGRCPALKSGREIDLSRFVWRRKRRAWQNFSPTLVAPSRWLADCARTSSLFHDLPIEVIPNGIDLTIFRPMDRCSAREILNLPRDRRLILFGAVNSMDDPRKGAHLLLPSLEKLRDRQSYDKIELLVFGSERSERTANLPFRAHYFGHLHDEISLALLYNAADVVAVPSLEDNFPNVVLEAMACGRPVVAFRIGGLPEMIEHGKNGYLTEPFSIDELSLGLDWCLNGPRPWQELSENAREKTVANFELTATARRYLRLYERLMDKGCN